MSISHVILLYFTFTKTYFGACILSLHNSDPSCNQAYALNFAGLYENRYFCCGQMAGRLKMPLGIEVGLGPGDFVLDGDPASPPQKGGGAPRGGEAPQFSAHVYCGKNAGWIKMTLDTEVGLGLGHIVLDEDPAPLPIKGAELPNFRPISIVTKRLDASRCHLVWR